jgi:ribosomal protein L30
MPEKKIETEKTKKVAVEKPAVKKTITKTTTAASKPATAVATKAGLKPTPKPAPKAELKVSAVKPATTVVTKAKPVAPPKPEAKPAAVKPPVSIEEKKPVAESVKTSDKAEGKKTIKGKILNITLLKSGIGYSKRHKATLKALGFRRLHQTIHQVDSPSLRGMLAKVNHLVRIEEQGTK